MITAEQVDVVQVDVVQELASVYGVLNQSYARLVALVSQALADEAWAIGGVPSPEHWLTIRAGLCWSRTATAAAASPAATPPPTSSATI